jgi:hypothetical protein
MQNFVTIKVMLVLLSPQKFVYSHFDVIDESKLRSIKMGIASSGMVFILRYIKVSWV